MGKTEGPEQFGLLVEVEVLKWELFGRDPNSTCSCHAPSVLQLVMHGEANDWGRKGEEAAQEQNRVDGVKVFHP